MSKSKEIINLMVEEFDLDATINSLVNDKFNMIDDIKYIQSIIDVASKGNPKAKEFVKEMKKAISGIKV